MKFLIQRINKSLINSLRQILSGTLRFIINENTDLTKLVNSENNLEIQENISMSRNFNQKSQKLKVSKIDQEVKQIIVKLYINLNENRYSLSTNLAFFFNQILNNSQNKFVYEVFTSYEKSRMAKNFINHDIEANSMIKYFWLITKILVAEMCLNPEKCKLQKIPLSNQQNKIYQQEVFSNCQFQKPYPMQAEIKLKSKQQKMIQRMEITLIQTVELRQCIKQSIWIYYFTKVFQKKQASSQRNATKAFEIRSINILYFLEDGKENKQTSRRQQRNQFILSLNSFIYYYIKIKIDNPNALISHQIAIYYASLSSNYINFCYKAFDKHQLKNKMTKY